MGQREQLVVLASTGEYTVTELAARFGISLKTAHKWIGRYKTGDLSNLCDGSRAPRHSPQRTDRAVERLILKL